MTKKPKTMVEYTCAPGVNSQSFDMISKTKDKKTITARIRGGCGKYFVPKAYTKRFEALSHIKKLLISGRITRVSGGSNSGDAVEAAKADSSVDAPAASLGKPAETPEDQPSSTNQGTNKGEGK